ncbi:uncharacterized protein LACBIDRAFT_331925 [Laccaria bicolor S238N-H82]|uniref:Predicted protein n=2 Tax=Laccaria bicolor (strain S238N-H82 / ATCC MYA-4686) TaxID=486041 RepID=B0DR26_LACBS|nr:uncharacterized protein LACBIDRAFT_331925 [Laccaria bicolor S238N-H82]EDR02924.1 predicted protein [Laccaria bicolor S238N-H82]|eukprot:XP_001886347.1 predicted protein [Laccaria bicolor S238N-H82]
MGKRLADPEFMNCPVSLADWVAVSICSINQPNHNYNNEHSKLSADLAKLSSISRYTTYFSLGLLPADPAVLNLRRWPTLRYLNSGDDIGQFINTGSLSLIGPLAGSINYGLFLCRGASGAQGDDTKSLKGAILEWIKPKGKSLNLPLAQNMCHVVQTVTTQAVVTVHARCHVAILRRGNDSTDDSPTRDTTKRHNNNRTTPTGTTKNENAPVNNNA